jgi:hypothetical protein
MLTPYDDFPIHQGAVPVAQPVSGDPNHYDRYFFNGYDADRALFFGAAMGHYPNRQTIDGAFSVVHEGIEHSVFASGLMPDDRRVTTVGPITVVVDDPLRVLRVIVTAPEHGLEAELTFRARTIAMEEPRQTIVDGARLVMDYTRLTQWGAWEGSIRVHGTELTVTPDVALGTRDRSWGVRPVGEQAPLPPSGRLPELFWLWAPLNFDDVATHLALFEHADGTRWMQSGAILPVLDGPESPTWGVDDGVEHVPAVDYDLEWEPGTRRARAATVTLSPRDADPWTIELEPITTFRMRGLGYTHPEWGHGRWRGPAEVGGESLVLADVDPTDPSSIHIQQLVRARVGDRVGVGVLEQLVFGDHHPTGLSGFADGATG